MKPPAGGFGPAVAALPPPPPPADESVVSHFNKITAAGSPLISMAQQEGMKIANRRGLINSTIAQGAAQAEGYKAALPLAQQEAQTAAARNLNTSQIGSQERMQGADIAAQKERLQISTDAEMARLERQLAGADEQQRKDIEAAMARLRETNAAEMARLDRGGVIEGGLQAQRNAAEMDRLRTQIASAEGQQRADLQAQLDRLERSAQIDTAARTQAGQIQGSLADKQNIAEMDRLRAQIASSEGQQRRDLQAQLDRMEKAAAIDTAARTQSGLIQGELADKQNAAEMERLRTSLAGATQQQQADIIAQMERLRYGTEAENVRQQRDIASRQLLQGRELANLNFQQKNELASRLSLLALDLDSRADLQSASLSAEEKRQAIQIAAQERLQGNEFAHLSAAQKAEIAGQMDRLLVSGDQSLKQITASGEQERARVQLQGNIEKALQLTGAEQQRALATLQGDIASRLQTQQDAGAMERLGAQMQHELKVQEGDSTAKLKQIAASGDQEIRRLVEAGLQERESLAMNIAAGDRERVAASMVSIFNAEANLRAALLSNPQMPASERAAYERAIAGMGDPLRAFINQLFAPPSQSGAGAGAGGATPPPAPPPPLPTGGGGLIQAPGLNDVVNPGYTPPFAVDSSPNVTPQAQQTTGGLLDNPALVDRLREFGIDFQ